MNKKHFYKRCFKHFFTIESSTFDNFDICLTKFTPIILFIQNVNQKKYSN